MSDFFLGLAVVSSLFSVSWVEYFLEVWRLLLQTSPCLPLRASSLLRSESELTPPSTSLVRFPSKHPTRLWIMDSCAMHVQKLYNNCHCGACRCWDSHSSMESTGRCFSVLFLACGLRYSVWICLLHQIVATSRVGGNSHPCAISTPLLVSVFTLCN